MCLALGASNAALAHAMPGCDGKAASIYLQDGKIVGGPGDDNIKVD